MKDASVRDWKNMAHFSHISDKSVCVFDHESKSVRNPGPEIDWPIVWLFNAFHRKHILVPQKIPGGRSTSTTMRSGSRGVWNGHGLFARTAHVYQAFTSNHVKSRVVQNLIFPIAKCWTTGLRNVIMNAARKGCSEATNNRFTNGTLQLRWARRRHRTSQWTVQSDKDGGFVMCAKHDIPQIHAKLPVKDMHDERHRHQYDTQCVIKCCSMLAKKIAKYEDELVLARAIMKPWSNKNCMYSGVKFENHTNLLVKSHSARARKCGLPAGWSGTLGGYKN